MTRLSQAVDRGAQQGVDNTDMHIVFEVILTGLRAWGFETIRNATGGACRDWHAKTPVLLDLPSAVSRSQGEPGIACLRSQIDNRGK